MFSDVAIGAGGLARAVAFRDTALAPLGIGRASSKCETWAAWRRPGEAATRARPAPPASSRCGWRRAPRSPQRTGIAAGRCLRASDERKEPMRGTHVATGRRTAASDLLAERDTKGVRGLVARGLAGAVIFGMGPSDVTHRTARQAPRVAA